MKDLCHPQECKIKIRHGHKSEKKANESGKQPYSIKFWHEALKENKRGGEHLKQYCRFTLVILPKSARFQTKQVHLPDTTLTYAR